MTATRDQFVSQRLVGRGDELARLRAAAAKAVQGGGHCLFVAGESGIGKTRLLAELRAGFAGQVLLAQCYAEEQSFPLAPLQFGLAEVIAGLPSRKEGADPAATQRALFEALSAALFERAARQPLLLIFEDLHWSDESTLAFIRFLARRLEGRPVLLIGTYRPGERGSFAAGPLADLVLTLERERASQVGPAVTSLALGPLDRAEIDALLRHLLGGQRPLAAAFVDAVAAVSEGNPLYVEELVRAMIQAGEIMQAGEGWVVGDVARAGRTLPVPAGMQEAVRRQSEALSPNAARVLRVAAVAGREFEFGVLADVAGLSEAELVGSLKELIAAGLVREEREDEFTFRHPLHREAVQGQLLARERRALHLQVAQALARRSPDPMRDASALAYHFYEAAAWEQALAFSRTAAEHARRVDATAEALRHLTRALESAQRLGLAPPLDLLLMRADLYERTGEFESADADLQAARAEAERTWRRREAWEALVRLGYLWAARDYRRSLAFLEDALAVAESLEDPLPRAATLNRIGNVYLNRDEPAAAVPYHRAALSAYEAAGDVAGQAATLELLGVCYYNLPDILAGAQAEEAALLLGRATEDRSVIFHASIHLLLPLRFETEVGPPVDAGRLAQLGEGALAIARTMGWAGGEAQALGLLGGFLALLGQYERGLQYLRDALALAERVGYAAGISAGERMLASALLELQAFDEAETRLHRALKEANAAGAQLFADIAALNLCQVLALRRGQGDMAEAARLLPDLFAAGRIGNGRIAREALAIRAELELSQGDAAAALATVEGLLAQACNLQEGNLAAVPRLALLHGRALAALHRHAEAARSLSAAIGGAASQGRRPLLWQAFAARGRLHADARERRLAQQDFAQVRAIAGELAMGIGDPRLRDTFTRRALATIPQPAPPSERRRTMEAHFGLSERERVVARLVAAGQSNRAIGETLVISERTAERHVANILAKLGLASRVQLAAWVAEHLPAE